jgi:hypothetical protein
MRDTSQGLGGKIATVTETGPGREVTFELNCVNQHHEQILIGTATIVVDGDASAVVGPSREGPRG